MNEKSKEELSSLLLKADGIMSEFFHGMNSHKRSTFAPSPTLTQYVFWHGDNAVI